MATSKLSMKLLIDKKAQKVVCAEAGKGVVDFMFSLLSLPVASVITILTKQSMVGCVGNLFESLENLSDAFIQSTQNKDSLLNPQFHLPLLLDEASLVEPSGEEYYSCDQCWEYITRTKGTPCPHCWHLMCTDMNLVGQEKDEEAKKSKGEGYVKDVMSLMTYVVMDNLVVRPMSTISFIALLNKLNIMEVDALEEIVVDLSVDESDTVLTQAFLGKKGA